MGKPERLSWKQKAQRITEASIINCNWGPKQHRTVTILALAGKVGNLASLAKREERGGLIPLVAFKHELVDAYVYVQDLAKAVGISLDFEANKRIQSVLKQPNVQMILKSASTKKRRIASAKKRTASNMNLGRLS